METKGLRTFLEIPYDELEEKNLRVKEQRIKHESADKVREERIKYLTDERKIKAVTVCLMRCSFTRRFFSSSSS